MTAKVTSSASDSLGAIPTAGRQGARCGEVFSRSSVVTYSAVARVSRAASTGPPRLDVGFATPILDALLHLRIWLLGGRKLRPLGIGHLGEPAGVDLFDLVGRVPEVEDSVLGVAAGPGPGAVQAGGRIRQCVISSATGPWQAGSECQSPQTRSHGVPMTPIFAGGRRRPPQGAVGPVSVASASSRSCASLPVASWWWRCSRVRA